MHFVGDLHQPFHAIERSLPNGDSDQGANLIDVTFFGESTNLHAVWDSGLILHAGRAAEDYTQYLKTNYLAGMSDAEWRTGSLADWAEESRDAARPAYVAKGAVLDQAYFDANIALADKRLALAGARLAMISGGAFKVMSAFLWRG